MSVIEEKCKQKGVRLTDQNYNLGIAPWSDEKNNIEQLISFYFDLDIRV